MATICYIFTAFDKDNVAITAASIALAATLAVCGIETSLKKSAAVGFVFNIVAMLALGGYTIYLVFIIFRRPTIQVEYELRARPPGNPAPHASSSEVEQQTRPGRDSEIQRGRRGRNRLPTPDFLANNRGALGSVSSHQVGNFQFERPRTQGGGVMGTRGGGSFGKA